MDSSDSEMELLYETYLSSDDQVIEIERLIYYKIIKKDFLELENRSMSLTMIPSECIVDGRCLWYCDENHFSFHIGPPAHYSFNAGNVPV